MSSSTSSYAEGEVPDTAATTPPGSRIVTGASDYDDVNINADYMESEKGEIVTKTADDHLQGQAHSGAEQHIQQDCYPSKTEELDAKIKTSGDEGPGKVVDTAELKAGYKSDGEDENDIATELSREVRWSGLAQSLEERRKSSKKRNLQASQYLVLIEDRLKELEETVAKLQTQQLSESEGAQKGEEGPSIPPPEPEKLLTQPSRFLWPRFCAPTPEEAKERQAVFEFLVETPYSLDKESKVLGKPSKHVPGSLDPSQGKPVERIRFNSSSLVDVFRDIFDDDSAPTLGEANLKPFKAIIPYMPALSAKASELENHIATAWPTPDPTSGSQAGDRGKPRSEFGEDATRGGSKPAFSTAELEESAPCSDSDSISPELKLSVETLEHLRALIDSIHVDLGTDLQTHELLRSRHKVSDASAVGAKINFSELWHLFEPGDLIYDPVDNQALRVLAVRGGRQMLAKEGTDRHSDPYSLRDPDETEAVTAISQFFTTGDQLTDFVLTCFYLDFNGECVGPVQVEKPIEPFDGVKEVKNLSVMPIEYADPQAFRVGRSGAGGATNSTQSVQEILLARGRKFASLAGSKDIVHCDYSGFSLGRVRDQIDSQVIVDLDLYYQKNPEKVIELGFREPKEGDAREVEESYIRACYCGTPRCTLGRSSNAFDDRKVDKFRTNNFLGKHQYLVRFTEPRCQEQMLSREDCVVLFPRQIWAFVLRSRSWAALDVGRVAELKPRTQSFEELVLPKEHKDIVEALVRTHSRGAHSVEDAASSDDTERREDLVRGKGKGVILLLHGVPGVGKTSTAECVAEYTKRPLFALTCGDIGDNARDVEDNLTESFQLAHRWGCVMLLDEADVFLQSRSMNRDLGRNAVVSVFLGMLEYYSGILFLTTNKIGTFDEAFKSRIHVSLYYKELDKQQTMEIWRLNLDRIAETRKGRVSFDRDEMMEWMKKFFKRSQKDKARPWNGRQIKNACQTAAALAEFQNKGEITKDELKAVADASAQFDRYLMATHGKDDMGRAQERADRGDETFMEVMKKFARSSDLSPSQTQRRKERSSSPRKSSKKKGKSDKVKVARPALSSGSGSSSSDDE